MPAIYLNTSLKTGRAEQEIMRRSNGDRRGRNKKASNKLMSEALMMNLVAGAGFGYEPEINGFWHNQSFHNYADCTLSEPFCHSLAQLIELGRQQRCAIMCSEAVCWRCHRRIVVDQLIARGESVFHLRGKDKIDPAKLTTEAKIQKNGEVITIRLKNNTLRPLLSFNQASCS